MFEPVWNRNYIDHVQITAAEDIGIGTRAGYYDGAGALRDLVQNHMMQLLANCLHGAADVLRRRQDARREGQGDPGDPPADGRGGPGRWRSAPSTDRDAGRARRCAATCEEDGVPPDSKTETFAALRLRSNNWRWAGVPFYLRTGKRLARKVTEIAVSSSPSRIWPSRPTDPWACSPTSWCSRSSPTRA